MNDIKRIGILTSGGDCAGLNAVLRAVVLRAAGHGWATIGIEHGTLGLMQTPPRAHRLDPVDFDGALMRRGGTILGTTNTGDPFAFPQRDGGMLDRSQEAIAGYRALKLDALIAIGGDGSLAILNRLARQGDINLIGIPKTIDNDIGATEVAVGYDTAVQIATEALDRLQPTAASHRRVMILEVMGRDAGHIALAAGIAGGADIILVPEIPYTTEALARKIQKGRFDLDDMAKQLGQMRKMGGLSEMMKLLPGVGKIKQQMAEAKINESAIVHQEAIISSMTKHERVRPKIIHASRKRRIAAGSGSTIQEVNKLLKQFQTMQKMIKRINKMGKKGLMRHGIEGLMPRM